MKQVATPFFSTQARAFMLSGAVLLFWGGLSSLTSCTRKGPGSAPAVALVDGASVQLGEFAAQVAQLRRQMGEVPTVDATSLDRIRSRVLSQMIDRQLLLNEAGRRGIHIERAATEEEVNVLLSDDPGTKKALLRENYVEEPAFIAYIRDDAVIRKLLDQIFASPLEVTDTDLHAYYETNRSQFEQRMAVHAAQIVVADEQLAMRLYKDILQRPAKFAEYARQHSIGPEKARDGDIGWMYPGEGPTAFDVLFKLRQGEFSEVVHSPFGYHIFLVLERRDGKHLSFEEAREKILGDLTLARNTELYNDFISRLRASAQISVDRGLLETVR